MEGLPLFMRSLRLQEPVFDPASLLPDMGVVVLEYGLMHKAVVVAKARVWVTVRQISYHGSGQPRTWRFRLDDQTDGQGGNRPVRFRTVAQHEHQCTLIEALAFLREQGVKADMSGLWSGHVIELARLVWPGRKKAPDNPLSTGRVQ